MIIVKKIVGMLSLIVATYLTLMTVMAELPWNTLEPWYIAGTILCLTGAGLVLMGVFNRKDSGVD